MDNNSKRKRTKKAGIKPAETTIESQSSVQHSFTSPVSILINQARAGPNVQSSHLSNESCSNETNVDSDSFEREECQAVEGNRFQ